MIAKCARCQYVFTTDRFGRQSCPSCGAELVLPEAPSGAPTPSLPPPPTGEPVGEPPLQPTPWEERDKRGAIPAYFETLKLSLTEPGRFFERMRVDNADGALSFFWITTAIGVLVGQAWQLLFHLVGLKLSGMAELPESDPSNPFAAFAKMQESPALIVGLGLASAVFAPVALYLSAGIYHLFLMLFKGAKNGFDATLRAVGYSSGPDLLQVIPLCGGVIAQLWKIVLIIIGLWKTQRTTPMAAIGAVIAPLLIALCCGCAVAAVAIAGVAAALGAAGG